MLMGILCREILCGGNDDRGEGSCVGSGGRGPLGGGFGDARLDEFALGRLGIGGRAAVGGG